MERSRGSEQSVNHNQSFNLPYKSSNSPGSNFSRNSSPNNSFKQDNVSSNFIPIGYSSPVNNSGGRGWKQRQNFNRRFASSPCTPVSYNNFSPYQQYNRSWKQNKSSGYHNSTRGNIDISDYIHPSMFEDPWSQLAKKTNSSVNKPSTELSSITQDKSENSDNESSTDSSDSENTASD